MKSAPGRLFVYGTLRHGFPLHGHLKDVRPLGRGKIQGRLFDLGEFPGAWPSSDPSHEIEGEVYELLGGDAQLRELDQLEEYDPRNPEDSLFVRRQVKVRLVGADKIDAWAYFLPKKPSRAREIPSGDYADPRLSKK